MLWEQFDAAAAPPGPLSSNGPVPDVQHTFEWIFIVLQIVGGQICLPLLLLTYLFLGSNASNKSRPLQRDPIVINFVISWIISSICYSLLLYWERSDDLLQSLDVTNPSLCLAQAALIPASQAFTSSTTFILVLGVWSAVIRGSSLKTQGRQARDKWIMAAFLVSPYVIFLAFSLQAYLVGRQSVSINIAQLGQPPRLVSTPNLAISTILYCVIALPSDSSTVPILPSGYVFSIILMVFTVFIEVGILWQIRKITRNKALIGVYRQCLVRVMVFSIYRVCTLGMVIGVAVKPDVILIEGILSRGTFAAFTDIIQSAAPLMAFLILSTRADVRSAWGLKKQKSSIEVVEGLDRERIFRANRYAPTWPIKSLEEGSAKSLDESDESAEGPTRLEPTYGNTHESASRS